MNEFIQTLLIACIPAVITGIVTYLVADKKSKSQINVITQENKHDMERLIEQHKVDIDSLKEEYHLKMELSEQEHHHKIEIIEQEHNNAMLRKEKEIEKETTYGMMKEVVGDVLGGLMNSIVSNPTVQTQIEEVLSNDG